MGKGLLAEQIRSVADTLGIDALGFADASEFTGYALPDSPRRDPGLSLPDAKTIIVAGIYIGGCRLPEWTNPWYGRTSHLYLSGYFLDVVKPLEPIAELLTKRGYRAVVCDGSKAQGSVLPLKLAAVRAGLGWQGKNSLLVSKKFGTFLALGGIITDADLEHNTTEQRNRCRSCDLCREACPLGALEQPYVLDRSRCLSHLLQAERLPEAAQAVMENRVGDCEICQQACPWNRKHLARPLATNMTGRFQRNVSAWTEAFHLPYLCALSRTDYEKRFGPLNTKIPYHLFQRNVSIAAARANAQQRFR